VSCLPKDLPEFIDVDLSSVEMNQMVYLADLVVPEGVEIPELTHGRNAPVASIHHARAEEVETPGAEAVAAAGAVAAAPAAAPAAAAKPAEAKGKEAKK
jgi:large subunit ribosomal protein L25